MGAGDEVALTLALSLRERGLTYEPETGRGT